MSDKPVTSETTTVGECLIRATRLCQQGQMTNALHEFRKVLELQPDNIQALSGASWINYRNGNVQHAVNGYKRIIELQPDNAEALNTLGAIYHEYGGLPQAVHFYEQATRVNPGYVEAHNNLAGALQRLYLTDEALKSYRRALELEPAHPTWELRIASLCRPVARSSDESDKYRSGLLKEFARYAESGLDATPEELVQTGPFPSYSLMYHGRDDRPIREAYARVFQPCFPTGDARKTATGHNRIGLVVTKTHEDLFVRSMGGVLRHMDMDRFELVVICIAGREKYLGELLDCPEIRILPVPEQITGIAQILGDTQFDILYYWEIATDPLNYFLPYYRLAPVQCTSWGIQVTSGIPTVDYYLSSDLVEPEHADANYTETLVCADTLLTYQYRSRLPDNPRRREDFGFRRDQHLYLFTQQMGKFHPELDAVVGEILRRDEQGVLVVLQGIWPYTAEQLRDRLSGTIGDVIERVTFLPRLDHADLLCLIADSEVLLDPPHYGGVNSSYDGFSMNTPIVTCESPFHVGRYTAACYRKMGLSDCIATDLDAYVDMAVDLGTDPAHRSAFSERIRGSSSGLYEDMGAVREHERIFEELINRLEPG